MAASESEVWRDRVAGIVLAIFGAWNIATGELPPFPTRHKVEGLAARIIGGIIVLIGGIILARTISRGEGED